MAVADMNWHDTVSWCTFINKLIGKQTYIKQTQIYEQISTEEYLSVSIWIREGLYVHKYNR